MDAAASAPATAGANTPSWADAARRALEAGPSGAPAACSDADPLQNATTEQGRPSSPLGAITSSLQQLALQQTELLEGLQHFGTRLTSLERERERDAI